ncbi:MAG: T9SS type A sorting domain-containing protein [Ignavibacteria bacterium]|nr:T9SS type A sorting domain-containing protein [Ignavibacteria bacterium]
MKLIKLIVILMLCTLNLYSQVFPKVEDYQIEGFENINFINVLLDAESSITNFYAITDDGKVYDIKNMGHMPTTKVIFQIDGDISEALTYDSLHYLSLITNENTYLIRTNNFIDIDTLYSEEGFEINDFQIYNNTISLIVNSKQESKIIYRDINASEWNCLEVPEFGFNRLAVLRNNYYLYKYLHDDTSILINNSKSLDWTKLENFKIFDFEQFTDIIRKDTIMFALGKHKSSGEVILFDENLGQPSGQFWTPGAPGKNTIYYDIAFDRDYVFVWNTKDNYQVGRFDRSIDSSGAYLYKSVFQGDAYQNRKTYKSSYALRKIISNDFNQHKEFVAVGHNGFVLLINRGLSDVETQKEKEDNISLYPNPAIKKDEVTINSIEVMKSITITDLMGKVLYVYSGINKLEFQFLINKLPSASYFVRIETNKAVVSRSISVVR